MEEKTALSKVATHVTRGCLVVPIQEELYDETIFQIQKDVLERIKETGTKGVIIDVSAVDIIDSFLAQAILDTARMAALLGTTTVLTGLKPGVVAALIDLEFEFKDIQLAQTQEEGFQRLEPKVLPKKEPEEIEEAEEEPLKEDLEEENLKSQEEPQEEELPEEDLEDET